MTEAAAMHVQYITDEAGDKNAVVLPIEEYEDLLEDLRDLAAVAERRDEETVSHTEVVPELDREGLL